MNIFDKNLILTCAHDYFVIFRIDTLFYHHALDIFIQRLFTVFKLLNNNVHFITLLFYKINFKIKS